MRFFRSFIKMLRSEAGVFSMNQFKLTNQVGDVMNTGANVIQAIINPSLAAGTYYMAGQVVSLGTDTNDTPTVLAATAGRGIGVIVFNERINQYSANMPCGVALDGTIINMLSSVQVARGQVVGWGSTFSSGTAIGIGPIASGSGIGIALDNCSATGTDIFRVLIKSGMGYNTLI